MTLFSRVATVAVMSFSLAGLMATSTPGRAADLAVKAIPAFQLVNEPAVKTVPADVPVPATVDQAAPVAIPDRSSAPDRTTDDVKREFASLAAAVAAHDSGIANEAMRCLAGAIYFESKGEPLSGQLAVAEVILNRARSGRYPSDVCGVITQRGQFGFVRGGRIPAIDEARAAYRTAAAVARVALADAWDSAASKALYFNTSGRAPGARLQRVAAIGNHIFYR